MKINQIVTRIRSGKCINMFKLLFCIPRIKLEVKCSFFLDTTLLRPFLLIGFYKKSILMSSILIKLNLAIDGKIRNLNNLRSYK